MDASGHARRTAGAADFSVDLPTGTWRCCARINIGITAGSKGKLMRLQQVRRMVDEIAATRFLILDCYMHLRMIGIS